MPCTALAYLSTLMYFEYDSVGFSVAGPWSPSTRGLRAARRKTRRVLDILPERLALLVLDRVLLSLGDDVDRGAVEGGADLARVEGAVVVRVVPGEPALVARVLPERCEKFHRLHRALGIEDDTLAGGIRLGAPVAPQERVREGRRIAEAVPERLADRLALGLELSARLAPGVHRLGKFGQADLRVPRAPPGDRVAAGAVRHGQPPAADLGGGVERVVEAALRPGDGLRDVGDVDETVGVELRPVVEHLEDVGTRAGLDARRDARLQVVGI